MCVFVCKCVPVKELGKLKKSSFFWYTKKSCHIP